MTRHPYYNYSRVLSCNGVYNFVVGGRGLGKTYGAKRKAIRDALRKGDQFIYLRRYRTELGTARGTFFADIEHEFPDYDFRVNGYLAEAAPVDTREDKKRRWQTIGFFVALSTAQTQKSVAFPRVKTIIFDEFIIENGALHYLQDETTIFNNFYSTVDRWTDKTRAFFLANSVSIMNPYFLKYEIRPDEGKDLVIRDNGFIVAHFPDAENFQSSVYETKFGRFIAGTEYAQYAVGNTFSDNHDGLIEDKTAHSKYRFSLETANGTFSVWIDQRNNEYFIQEKLPGSQLMFTMLPERMADGKVLMRYTDPPLAHLRSAFNMARISFDKPSTRNTFAEIFKR